MKKVNENKGLFINQTVELELLISVTIIFASFGLSDWFSEAITWASNHNFSGKSAQTLIIGFIGLFLTGLLPVAVGFHFISRIYWLALTSLQSAYADQPKRTIPFQKPYLKKFWQASDLSTQIKQVDMVSSSIFAFAFLAFFAFTFGVGAFMLVIASVDLLNSWLDPSRFLSRVIAWYGYIMVAASLLSFIDFFTLGMIRRSKYKWVRQAFYPIHVFFSVITLSFLYRGIYYKLAQHTPRGLLVVGLFAIIILSLIGANIGYEANQLTPEVSEEALLADGTIVHNPMYYNTEIESFSRIKYPYIQAYILPARTRYLRLSIPMTLQLEDYLLDKCDSVKAFREKGLTAGGLLTVDVAGSDNEREKPDPVTNSREVLSCIQRHLILHLDSSQLDSLNLYFDTRTDPVRQLVSTVIPIHDLTTGQHTLTLTAPEDMLEAPKMVIPFYLE